jgi:hypothetical protein
MSELQAARYDGKVVRGEDGWLFLDSDSNSVMRQHRGELRFTDDQLDAWRALLTRRSSRLAEYGTRYAFLIPPNPHSVYAEKLPSGSGDGSQRPVFQLLEHVKGSPPKILYPLDDMLANKHRCIYNKTGSHWTDLGAFIGYRALMTALGVRALTEAQLAMWESERIAELGAKLQPPVSAMQTFVEVRNPHSRMVSDNRVANTGRRIEYRSDAPDTCLLFGDSFSHNLLPFMAESFGRLVFAHLPTLDYALVEREQPDIVVSLMNERFLISVPQDDGALTLTEHERAKREAGTVYPPRETLANRVSNE